MSTRLFAALLTSLSIMSGQAMASVTFTGMGTGPGSVPVSASALFDITGNILTITLRNISASNNGQDVPGSTLTGLFWDSISNRSLTPFSATIAPGSSIVQGNLCNVNCAAVTNVSGEFGYQQTSFAGNADRGIASSGYLSTGLSGNIGNFNNGAAGTNLHDPNSLDGINFGIVSAASGFNPNGGLQGAPLIQDAVVFMLTGVNGLTTADIRNVSFQYGTSLSELNIQATSFGGEGDPSPVPLPGMAVPYGLSVLMALAARRRRAARS